MVGYGKFRKVMALLIGLMPSASVRRFGYRRLGYQLGARCRIGFGAVIAVESFVCDEDCLIGTRNRFIGPMHVRIGKNCMIGRENYFTCGEQAASSGKNYARTLILGDNVLIHEQHIFDLYGKIEIGSGTWVAGFRSQFLTHGLSVTDRDITVGTRVYMGSAVYIQPGATLSDETIIAMGSVVNHKFTERGVIIGGVPARVLRKRDERDYHDFDPKTLR